MKRRVAIIGLLVSASLMLSGCVIKVTEKSSEGSSASEAPRQQDIVDESQDSEKSSASEKESVEDTSTEMITETDKEEEAPSSEEAQESQEPEKAEDEWIMDTLPAPSETEKPEAMECTLAVDVVYESNIVMAKYSIDVYLDGEKIGNVENGNEFLHSTSTMTGSHTLKFEKRGDSSIMSFYKFDVVGDSTVLCSLKSHTDEIEIRSQEVKAEAISMEANMPDLTEKRLDKAIDELEKLGFINIYTKSQSTIIIKSNWVVIAQNYPAGESVDKSAQIILTCEKDG